MLENVYKIYFIVIISLNRIKLQKLTHIGYVSWRTVASERIIRLIP